MLQEHKIVVQLYGTIKGHMQLAMLTLWPSLPSTVMHQRRQLVGESQWCQTITNM